jgi:phage N-6-adenine-methyltransferase
MATVKECKSLVAKAKRLQAAGNVTSWQLADIYAELAEAGWTQQKIADECEASQQSVSRFIRCAKLYSVQSNRPSFWEALVEVDPTQSRKAVHVSQNTGQPEWYTPPEYIDAAREVLGDIDLDPATSEVAQETVQASDYFTAETNGLDKPWQGRVWLNPPYAADLVGKFAAKLVDHYREGDIAAAMLLVNNATDTEWFQKAASDCKAVCFPSGRIRFLDDQGKPGAPLQGQAILYFGEDKQRFMERFATFGFCLETP